MIIKNRADTLFLTAFCIWFQLHIILLSLSAHTDELDFL
jgi:hypothetical protein